MVSDTTFYFSLQTGFFVYLGFLLFSKIIFDIVGFVYHSYWQHFFFFFFKFYSYIGNTLAWNIKQNFDV
jgi:hypothetical protein